MNAISQSEFSLVSQNILESYCAQAPLFLATPNHALLAQDIVGTVAHSSEPLGERVRQALTRARDEGHLDAAVVGAIPFDIDRPSALRVARTLLRTDPLNVTHAPPPAMGRYDAQPVPHGDDYAAGVAQAVANIRSGQLDKVVLARMLELSGDEPVDAHALLTRLAARNPQGYTFSVDVGEGRTLLGASPELLVSRFQGVVRANPLAGSAPRSSDPVEDRRRADALMASAKDLEEHRVVVDAVRESLAPLCRTLHVPERPSLVHTQTMWHLSTEVTGATDADALTLALALHPTPAVCGYPRSVAQELILQTEPFDRGFYTGMLGWVDTRGDGEWIVTIRCAEAAGNTLRLFAGAGVVGESQPEAELAETSAKFRTMLDAMGVARDAATGAAARGAA
ncbi:isochorismate synthase [Burkholderia alba]|uniref:isochorismate synthase n=1 Tax=Burkholderia alba TaxID=2683677 RepID=UPI002B056EBC|nr:isochorismate synthase [Burkholderia alba]